MTMIMYDLSLVLYTWEINIMICLSQDPGFYLELEFVQCELMMSSFAEKKECFHKSVVDVCICFSFL